MIGEYRMSNLSRRELLKGTAACSAFCAAQSLWPAWLPRLAFASNGISGDVIVCIFLRGGADCLNMIAPFGDEAYYQARPTLALARPDSHAKNRLLPLDDFFGLNPDMRGLHELFTAGHMTAIHAVGAPSAPRSHFEAMDLLERGIEGKTGADSGWLGRHLLATSHADDSPLRAISWDETLPTSLRGYVSANAFRSITDYHLNGKAEQANQMAAALAAMYQGSSLDNAAHATLDALKTISQINVDHYQTANRAAYTDTDFGRGLKQTAALIKAAVGLEVACVDLGNFDTHILQGVTLDGGVGGLPQLVKEFSDNLRAFHDDLLDHMNHVTVVVMSEFGRRVQENGAGGTDHGHGGVMYIMSEHLAVKPVTATWPGLNPHFLEDGDLQITVDYRDVLGEILLNRTVNNDLSSVFPGHIVVPIGLFAKR
jgi:uncharacterized protein (DUF1501 family)